MCDQVFSTECVFRVSRWKPTSDFVMDLACSRGQRDGTNIGKCQAVANQLLKLQACRADIRERD